MNLSSVRPPPGGYPEASGALPVSMFASFGTEELDRKREEAHFVLILTRLRHRFRRGNALKESSGRVQESPGQARAPEGPRRLPRAKVVKFSLKV